MMPLTPEETAGIQATVQTLEKLASDTSTAIWKSSTEALEWFAKTLKETFLSIFENPDDARWNAMLQPYRNAGLLSDSDVAHIKQLGKYTYPLGLIFYIMVLFQLAGKFLTASMEAGMARMAQGINKQYRPSLPQAETILDAAFIAPEKTGEIRDVMARFGIPEKVIDLMFLARYARTPLEYIRDLWLRKVLSDDKMYERMRELGFTDTRIKEITQAWSIIPPPSDILMMVGHEAFEPDSIRKMGLDAEFPEEQSEWLEKQGLSRYWQMKYWIAHWEQPSLQMGFEMLHRGVIDRETLEFLFRTVEIPPYWREKLVQIAYQPYTRVDVRRMHAMGVIDDAALIKAYKDLGYDQEHAEKMAEFTIRYNQGAEKELTKGEILTGYRDKLLRRADARDLLVQIGYREAQAEYYLDLEDYKEVQDLQNLQLKDIEARYKKRLIDAAEASRRLDELGLPAAQKQALLDKWSISLVREDKLPTKGDLDKFYLLGVIDQDHYRIEMERLGYAHYYIDWYVQYLDVMKKKKPEYQVQA